MPGIHITRTKRANSKLGSSFLMLFGLPFAAVGVGMGYLLVSTLLEYQAIQGWQEVPARIVRTELETHRGNKSTSYKATAEYTYTFGRGHYTGTRVGLHGGSDNIGSFQQNAYRELKEHQQSGRPFRCYVNPNEPSQAILYRELRWEMLLFNGMFMLVFGGAGIGMVVGGFLSRRKARRQTARAAEFPDEPWRWRDEWAEGEIHSSGRAMLVSMWGVAIVWNLISLPVLFFTSNALLKQATPLVLLFLLFPAVGFTLLAVAVYLLLRWRKYGDSTFQLAAIPGVIGGKLAGVIRTSAYIRPEDGYRLTLKCIHRYTTGSGKQRKTHEKTLWQDERTIARGLSEEDFSQTVIPVLFGIPFDAPPSDPYQSDDQVVWRLEITADVPGIDYAATFEVPVFKTAESRADFQLDDSVIAPYVTSSDLQA